MRPLLSDGFNSLAHVVIGGFGFVYRPVLYLSILYQFVTENVDNNRIVDIAENFIGFGLMLFQSQ